MKLASSTTQAGNSQAGNSGAGNSGAGASWGVVQDDMMLDIGTVPRDRYPDLRAVISADALEEVRQATTGARRIAFGLLRDPVTQEE